MTLKHEEKKICPLIRTRISLAISYQQIRIGASISIYPLYNENFLFRDTLDMIQFPYGYVYYVNIPFDM